ncbi:MAG: DUF3108 domain-containing protein [Gemmatimonadetes bacterium]|nr:DUF3108 domain-containing protein [Gemmatimonadota bacterium]
MTARFLTALALVASPAAAQGPSDPVDRDDDTHRFASEWPFQVGEMARYDVSWSRVRVGEAHLRVEDLETIRGESAYRLAFELEGGPFVYRIDDRTVSWLAVDPYRSLRFEQILKEGGYRRHRRYELDHEEGLVLREDWDEEAEAYRPYRADEPPPIPVNALDEIAYLYLIRTLPLEVGQTYTFHRYFEEKGNPVVLHVLREERIRVRAGTFDTIVVQPIIQTDGMFGEGGEAEVYLSNDERRLIVQLKTKMKVGELNMYLRDFEMGG